MIGGGRNGWCIKAAPRWGWIWYIPGVKPRPLPQQVQLVVFDFDGVMTDDRVWVDETGHEQVAANRRDGLGLELLRRAGFEILVLSKETNPVVTARCAKLGLAGHAGSGR